MDNYLNPAASLGNGDKLFCFWKWQRREIEAGKAKAAAA
ncbi:Hypothetical protein OINT_1001171 [Brucella intermedia LMG 3301]|uniref:Uncharacterized protein n=2 Tax=Brucella intermedia TaxID=94625 RepID=U4VBL6_9HYPH|nr:Hypothetical protein OINT_1001171 [Brucella intermedia LMG 3301]ERM00096.1 hypothetical protein Q644_07045 [Brucella intermedia 229E]